VYVYQIDASEKESALTITENKRDLDQLDDEIEMTNMMSNATVGNTEMSTEDICTICTEVPASGNAYATVCHHVFCKDCLFEWLKINQHCPNCRWWLEEFEDDILPGRAQNPRLPERAQNPRLPGRAQNPRLPRRSQNPILPGRAQNPRLPGRAQNPRLPEREQNPRLPVREQNPRLPESTDDIECSIPILFGEVIPFYYIFFHPLVIALVYFEHELGESECTPSRHLLNWSGFIVAFLRMFVVRYSEQLRIQWIQKKKFGSFLFDFNTGFRRFRYVLRFLYDFLKLVSYPFFFVFNCHLQF